MKKPKIKKSELFDALKQNSSPTTDFSESFESLKRYLLEVSSPNGIYFSPQKGVRLPDCVAVMWLAYDSGLRSVFLSSRDRVKFMELIEAGKAAMVASLIRSPTSKNLRALVVDSCGSLRNISSGINISDLNPVQDDEDDDEDEEDHDNNDDPQF